MDDWNWSKLLPRDFFHSMGDIVCFYVHMECIKGWKDSYEIAKRWDDNLLFDGWFYYRDWTKKCDKYWSGFWFENRTDAVRFQELYGGVGDWMSEYQDFVDRCESERIG